MTREKLLGSSTFKHLGMGSTFTGREIGSISTDRIAAEARRRLRQNRRDAQNAKSQEKK